MIRCWYYRRRQLHHPGSTRLAEESNDHLQRKDERDFGLDVGRMPVSFMSADEHSSSSTK